MFYCIFVMVVVVACLINEFYFCLHVCFAERLRWCTDYSVEDVVVFFDWMLATNALEILQLSVFQSM